jgi:hypothetical protein
MVMFGRTAVEVLHCTYLYQLLRFHHLIVSGVLTVQCQNRNIYIGQFNYNFNFDLNLYAACKALLSSYSHFVLERTTRMKVYKYGRGQIITFYITTLSRTQIL